MSPHEASPKETQTMTKSSKKSNIFSGEELGQSRAGGQRGGRGFRGGPETRADSQRFAVASGGEPGDVLQNARR